MGFNFDLNSIEWIKGSHGLPQAVYKIKIPSVTTIVNECIPDPEWDEFVAKVGKVQAEKILNGAGQRGSALHIFLENFITNYTTSKDISEALHYTQLESPKMLLADGIPENKIEEGRNLFYKFYYSDYPNRYSDMIAIELGVYSPTLFYRGKLDILYRDNIFGLSLTDFKSSNGKIKKGSAKEIKYFLQLGGYSNCIKEMYISKNITINQASILCVDKQQDILQEISLHGAELRKYENEFCNLVKEYHVKHGTEYLIANI